MFRVVLVLAACAALLSACTNYSNPISQPDQPPGKPLFITLQVQQHLNKYFQTIGGGRSGVFAVSQRGHIAFYAYCQAVQCRDEVDFTRTALRGCEARAHAPCVVLAVGRSIRQRYMTYQEAEEQGLI